MEKTSQDLGIITNYFSDFSSLQIDQFRALESLYNEWNLKINIISRKDMAGLYLKHVLHSLAIAAVFDFQPGTELIDLGTGGGFPGIPLAIFFPDVQFHLVDSIAKKVKVVEGIKTAIGLKNLTTEHTRVENIANRKFDFVVSRAVAPLNELWRWSIPLLRKTVFTLRDPGGVHIFNSGLICLKGGDLKNEIADCSPPPHLIEISSLFQEEFFKEKFLVYMAF
ncbi:MAG: 16S rRNA (guanine(527)-N(7))-methyltransferase RsmG [Flavisolibacter sp.]